MSHTNMTLRIPTRFLHSLLWWNHCFTILIVIFIDEQIDLWLILSWICLWLVPMYQLNLYVWHHHQHVSWNDEFQSYMFSALAHLLCFTNLYWSTRLNLHLSYIWDNERSSWLFSHVTSSDHCRIGSIDEPYIGSLASFCRGSSVFWWCFSKTNSVPCLTFFILV